MSATQVGKGILDGKRDSWLLSNSSPCSVERTLECTDLGYINKIGF